MKSKEDVLKQVLDECYPEDQAEEVIDERHFIRDQSRVIQNMINQIQK